MISFTAVSRQKCKPTSRVNYILCLQLLRSKHSRDELRNISDARHFSLKPMTGANAQFGKKGNIYLIAAFAASVALCIPDRPSFSLGHSSQTVVGSHTAARSHSLPF